MDAKTVTAFLAACTKAQDACNTEISDQVNAQADDTASHAVCLSDDQRDEPITISRAMLRWLRTNHQVASKPPSATIAAAARLLYPCDP